MGMFSSRQDNCHCTQSSSYSSNRYTTADAFDLGEFSGNSDGMEPDFKPHLSHLCGT